jgi:hypothetical protein
MPADPIIKVLQQRRMDFRGAELFAEDHSNELWAKVAAATPTSRFQEEHFERACH